MKEGFYTSLTTGAQFPKLQVLTIEGLLGGTQRARYPDLAQGGLTFKKARTEQREVNQAGLF